ncbi:MAG: BlaI family transcriptional regulator [Caulobacteraceae bacterium]|nr:BlaI family transcriptional regulator [Caulobacteraceae bacterium]
MPKKTTRISAAESQVMQVLWREAPLPSDQIVAAFADRPDWSEGTVRTLIRRLLGKGAVRTEPDGRRFLYHPVVTRADYVDSVSEGMLDHLFGGRLALMVTHFSERERFTPEDVAELKRMIARIEDKHG